MKVTKSKPEYKNKLCFASKKSSMLEVMIKDQTGLSLVSWQGFEKKFLRWRGSQEKRQEKRSSLLPMGSQENQQEKRSSLLPMLDLEERYQSNPEILI